MSKKRDKRKSNKQIISSIIFIIILLIISYLAPKLKNETNDVKYSNSINEITSANNVQNQNIISYNLSEIPKYEKDPYVIINNNIPYFTEQEKNSEDFETYSELDILGRCGVAYVNICKKTMPPEGDKRGDISSVKPTGWKQKKYNGEYLYNRCHLIGYQLSDEDANKLNIITGTRYFNVTGMLPFENQVAEHIKSQRKNEDRHVLYRVTPMYEGNNLVASGVEMEAYSIEDNGQGVCFNVYVYNVQPGIKIDYATGNSTLEN